MRIRSYHPCPAHRLSPQPSPHRQVPGKWTPGLGSPDGAEAEEEKLRPGAALPWGLEVERGWPGRPESRRGAGGTQEGDGVAETQPQPQACP